VARPPSSGDPLVGVTLEKRYTVRGLLGEGSSARVYAAVDVKVGRQVAIKTLQPIRRGQPDAVQRLLREGRIAATILHSSICASTDAGRLPDGTPFLVLERLHGTSLAEHLRTMGSLAPAVMVDVVSQIASVLTVAHAHGIVHRDIKPANIFLVRVPGRSPLPKLLDFGSALARGDLAMDESKLTATGMVIGTPMYMAPEQVTGARDIDGRTDIYACGVLLYEGLTGQRPFLARDYDVLLLDIATNAPVPILSVCPTVDPDLAEIVMRAMARDRAHRYPSAAALLTDLSKLRQQRVDRVPSRAESWDAATGRIAKPEAWDESSETRPR
jgi:serine/threonine-protein kinase